MANQVNVLGDIRAESDAKMLQAAFYESADYRALVESFDRPLVVGRRGTGKSALRYRLESFWSRSPKTTVIQLIPTEDQVIGVRPLLAVLPQMKSPVLGFR